MTDEKESSQITSQLNTRISTNTKFGTVNLEDWLLERLPIKDGDVVVDFGCGTGNHLIRFANHFKNGSYIGIDISKDSISQARQLVLEHTLDVTFLNGDESALGYFNDGSVDLVTSIYSLYYVKDTKKVLTTFKGKIKEGGRIAILAPYRGNNHDWFSFLSQVMKVPPKIDYVCEGFVDKEVLPFAQQNFKNVQTMDFENRVMIPDFASLVSYWKSNVYHKAEYDQAFEEHARTYFEHNKGFPITKKALLVIMGDKKDG